MPGRRLLSLLRVAAIAAMATFSLVGAYAAEPTPNLFESLGKFFQPRSETPAAPADGAGVATRGAAPTTVENFGPLNKRVALVIGNSAYPAGALQNPRNDAAAMSGQLKRLGFDVETSIDVSKAQLDAALRRFGERAARAEVAAVFYAGHGLQVNGVNYIVPVDAKPKTERDIKREMVKIDDVIDEMAQAKVKLVFFDACRDNPLARSFSRGGSRGLAAPTDASGTLISFATKHGNTAADGDEKNSPYTQALLAQLNDSADKEIKILLTNVSRLVKKNTGGEQEPWTYGSLDADFYLIFNGPTNVIVQPGAAVDAETEAWKAAESVNQAEAYKTYLNNYPKGPHAVAAQIKLDALSTRKAESARPGASSVASRPPPPAAVEDAETQFWNEVKASGAREYLDAYLKQYPRGKYAALARSDLKKLEDRDKAQLAREEAERRQAAEREQQEAQRAEQTAWDEAKTGASVAAYAGYLERYPKGRYATLAQAAQQKLQREAGEREKQETAQRRQEEERRRNEAEQQRLAAERERREAEKAAGDLRPGKTFRDCADCPEMVVIPAGSFEMGGSTFADEKPVHRVSVRGFAIGRTEVTQGQWRAVMGNNPSGFSTCGDDCPVERVSWDDAQEFVRKLNQKTGKSYRLPSEAEWEYACRAGGRHEYCGAESPDRVAWYDGNSGAKTHSVAGKQANAWGLYDMSGNVQEWTEDCWNKDYVGAPNDGTAWTTGECSVGRVLRGGSWNDRPLLARAALRVRSGTSVRVHNYGFRLARMLP